MRALTRSPAAMIIISMIMTVCNVLYRLRAYCESSSPKKPSSKKKIVYTVCCWPVPKSAMCPNRLGHLEILCNAKRGNKQTRNTGRTAAAKLYRRRKNVHKQKRLSGFLKCGVMCVLLSSFEFDRVANGRGLTRCRQVTALSSCQCYQI